MIIAVFSLSGAPGVTTLAVALASQWPSAQDTVVVEADACGGDIAAWYGLGVQPGVVDLAAYARGDPPADEAASPNVVQELPGGQRVCVAPPTADRAAGPVGLLAEHPRALGGAEVTVLDLGRLAPRSAAAQLAAQADIAVLVVRDEVDQLKRVREAVTVLRSAISPLGLAVVGRRERVGAITRAVRVPVWARIPEDRRGAAVVRGERRPSRMRPLLRVARGLGRRLLAETAWHAAAAEISAQSADRVGS